MDPDSPRPAGPSRPDHGSNSLDAFQKCSELSVEVAKVEYFEGGSLIPNKSPGRLTFADVTLERGATQDRDLFDWLQDVAITSSGLGLVDPYYKRNLDVV